MSLKCATEIEIIQQPDIWRSFAPNLSRQAQSIAAWIAERQPQEVWFSGAGTSAFIGESLAAFLNVDAHETIYRAVSSTDLVATPQNLLRADKKILVVSFGRSGNSPESIGVLDLLDSHATHYDRLHITCNASSALANRAMPAGAAGELKCLLLPPETEDRGFAMTSSYSTMLLSALSIFAAPSEGIETRLNHLADVSQTIIQSWLETDLPRPERAVFLGSGALAGGAREAALKILELTAGQVLTMFDTPLGFRHGPKAVVNDDTQIFIFRSSHSHTAQYEVDVISELQRQFTGRAPIVSGPFLEQGDDAWSVVLHVIVAQILAVRWSQSLGYNPDDPFAGRNLTRVVTGVQLYPFDDARAGMPARDDQPSQLFGGIDVGGTKIEARLYDEDMNEIGRQRVAIQKGDYTALIDSVVQQVEWLRQFGGKDVAIGIGLPGIIDPASGHSTTSNLPASGRALSEEISHRCGGAIAFANDCKLFALSEATGGAAAHANSVFGLIIGTGVGGGVVRAGILDNGQNGLPGEVGHIGIPSSLQLPVLRCGCGAMGCFETYLSGEGVSRLAELETGSPVVASAVFQRAEAGDAAMVRVTEQWFALLTEMLLTLQLTIDPDVVVIGGGLSVVPKLSQQAQMRIDKRVLAGTRAPQIGTPMFGDASGARGAALFAKQQLRISK